MRHVGDTPRGLPTGIHRKRHALQIYRSAHSDLRITLAPPMPARLLYVLAHEEFGLASRICVNGCFGLDASFATGFSSGLACSQGQNAGTLPFRRLIHTLTARQTILSTAS